MPAYYFYFDIKYWQKTRPVFLIKDNHSNLTKIINVISPYLVIGRDFNVFTN